MRQSLAIELDSIRQFARITVANLAVKRRTLLQELNGCLERIVDRSVGPGRSRGAVADSMANTAAATYLY